MPTQAGTTVPASSYHLAAAYHLAGARRAVREPAAGVLTPAARPGGRPVTTKSAYNRLATPGRSDPVS